MNAVNPVTTGVAPAPIASRYLQEENSPAPAQDVMFQAFDLNATKGPRTHELPHEEKGKTRLRPLTFADPFTPVPVPFDVAYRLAGIDGFRVEDKHGNEFKHKNVKKEPIVLRPDEIVARYTELTLDALRARAAGIPGLELKSTIKKEELIALIMSKDMGKSEIMDADDDDDNDPLLVEMEHQ